MEEVTKVELGCGTTKNEGYIGIDRFPFPNVDIVADLDKGIPLENDSVDVIFCSHSFEHFDNLSDIVNEIYRVCKHKAIVNILSPYHMETVNLANFYHKQVFNESTFRFFTTESMTSIDIKDYYNPHASSWGLASSDNSKHKTNFHTLNIECFYFPSYENLTMEEKRDARRSLLNVCDQIYYSLAVNKSENTFTAEEIHDLREKSKIYEVPVIGAIRNRHSDTSGTSGDTSILSDIKKWDSIILRKQELAENRLASRIDRSNLDMYKIEQGLNEKLDQSENIFNKKLDQIEQGLTEKLNQSERDLNERLNKNVEMIELIEKKFNDKLEALNSDNSIAFQNFQNQLNLVTIQKNSLAAIALDLIKSKESNTFIRKHFSLFKKSHDLFVAISSNHLHYTDGLILCNNYFNVNSIVSLSKTVPYDTYFEYKVIGYGKIVNYFIISNIGANLFVEVVQYGKIIKQDHITIVQEGVFNINIDEGIKGEIFLRFRVLDNFSIVRVLEITSRKLCFWAKKSLATYVE